MGNESNKMRKLLLGILFLVVVLVLPLPTMARVDIGVNISLPLPIVFVAPPQLIVLPETNVYVVPDVEEEIFFYNGWWWRPWEGRWYRSQNFSSGWIYYREVPSFYRQIPLDWRNYYREHRWKENQWDYQPIPHQQVQQSWRGWEKSRYWERHKTWGVHGLHPRMRSQQPPRNVHPQRPHPQLKAVHAPQSQHHRGGQKFQKAKPQHSQQQHGKHNNGKGGGKGQR